MAYFNTGSSRGLQSYPKTHHGMVSEFQVSGIPCTLYKAVGALSGDKMITITLPYVSKWIKLKLGGTVGTGATGIRVGFGDYSSSLGIQGDNYITAVALNTINTPLELKCKVIKIFVPNAVNDLEIDLIAGLTSIREFPDLGIVNLSGITTAATITASSSLIGVSAMYSVAAAAS